MKAYSQDLRERVIAAVDAGQHSQPEIAMLFEVSESTIDKWTKCWRDTGSVAAAVWVSAELANLLSRLKFLDERGVNFAPDAIVRAGRTWRAGRGSHARHVGPALYRGGRLGCEWRSGSLAV